MQEGDRRREPLLVLLVLAFTFVLCCWPMRSMDVWWHLRTGAEILRTGELPRVDWYTYTATGRPWIDVHWVFQLLLIGLYRLGGTDLLVLFKAAVTTAAVAIAWRAGARGAPAGRSALVAALMALVVSGQAVVRPKMLSLLALATMLLLARRSDRRPRAALYLVPLQVAWTNVQGLFVLGPIVVSAWFADRALRRLAGGRAGTEVPAGSLRFDLGILLAVGLACLASPYGLEGALFPLELWKKFSVDREVWSVVLEFQRPADFVAENGWGYAFLPFQGALVLLTALSFLPLFLRGRWSPLRLALFATFSYLGWTAMRNADLLALVAGWALLANLGDLARAGASPGLRFEAPVAAAAIAVGCLLVPTGTLPRLAGDGRRLGLGEPEAWYMHAPVEFASASAMPGGAFVRHIGQAAVYVWRSGPGRKVFMDGRLEVSTKEILARFHRISRLMESADPAFEEEIRLPNGALPSVLLDSRFSRNQISGLLQLRSRWRLVFADPTGAVFLDVETADRLGLPEVGIEPLENPPAPI